MRLGTFGIISTLLPTAAASSSGDAPPSSAVTYLSNMGQARTGSTSLLRSNIRHQQRCVAGATGYVNYGTAVYDVAGASAYPTGTRIHLFEDAAGSVGPELGRLAYVSHSTSTGVVVCASVTPVVVPAGPFWAETFMASGNTYFHRISGTSSTGRPGWTITDQAQFGTVSYALEFSLRYEP